MVFQGKMSAYKLVNPPPPTPPLRPNTKKKININITRFTFHIPPYITQKLINLHICYKNLPNCRNQIKQIEQIKGNKMKAKFSGKKFSKNRMVISRAMESFHTVM